MLFRRNYDGHVISMHQAGTHWLRNLVAHVIAHEHNLEIPDNIRSNAIVGGVNRIPTHDGPKIVQSHKIPGFLFGLRIWRRFLKFPKYIVLIRDPRVSTASHYKKHHKESKKTFSEFLRNEGPDGCFLKDMWDDIRFFNVWMPLAKSWPSNVAVVRYEDLRDNTHGVLKELIAFLGIRLKHPDTLEWSVRQCAKENMSEREDATRKFKVVRPDEVSPLSIFSADDRKYFLNLYGRYLGAEIPYDLQQW